MADKMSRATLPHRLVIVAGTYDGVIAGWDTEDHIEKFDNDEDKSSKKNNNENLLDILNSASRPNDNDSYLKMSFAMAVHDGSVRCLSIASSLPQNSSNSKSDETQAPIPGALLSAGFDESLAIFSLAKRVQSGELKTPSNLGTPTCSDFAPPYSSAPTHALIGLSSGKIVIYRRKDWSVEHVLPGHDDKGVTCISVHPSGKMALSGGRDGKICLWDLMRGRLAFVYKIPSPQRGRKCTVNHIVWSDDGHRYAYCTHEGNITAREMESGQDLLDITLPLAGRANQICFIGGEEGLFLAAACNDGGLPVFAVGSVDENEEQEGTRRALMAIEPVEGVASAREDRFKCIRSVKGGSDYFVVTANSGGVISVIDLEGAARMMLTDSNEESDNDSESSARVNDTSDDSGEEEEEEEEFAAEILESVRIGSGARITSISVWSAYDTHKDADIPDSEEEIDTTKVSVDASGSVELNECKNERQQPSKKRKSTTTVSLGREGEIQMDSDELEKARKLVRKANKRQKRKSKKL